jgi:hypothetical protein
MPANSRSRKLIALCAILLAGCNLGVSRTAAPPSHADASPRAPSVSATPNAQSPLATEAPAGAFAVRFMDLSDGASVTAALDSDGRSRATIRVEVTGAKAMMVTLSADGIPNMDAGGHPYETFNADQQVPFLAEIGWYPPRGGGEYTLTANAISEEKQTAQASVRVTVTGVASFTPLPPALSRTDAARKFASAVMEKFKVFIPAPSLQRFDFPTLPARSRWIGAAFYQGTFYYYQMFDDGHEEWSVGAYADPRHKYHEGYFIYCRPSGTYRILVLFVDYGNTGAAKDAALAKVPVVVQWLNGLYAKFAKNQGFSAPLMRVEADAAFLSAPPIPGELLNASQIRAITGKNIDDYDIRMQIDLDKNGSFAAKNFPGLLSPGGGLALQGCGVDEKYGDINIWSSSPESVGPLGGLTMDFNHELSHLFGMMDDWPFNNQVIGPEGANANDWIPYTMFGWTDTDGDGIPEIIDPTPYGTAGPMP